MRSVRVEIGRVHFHFITESRRGARRFILSGREFSDRNARTISIRQAQILYPLAKIHHARVNVTKRPRTRAAPAFAFDLHSRRSERNQTDANVQRLSVQGASAKRHE